MEETGSELYLDTSEMPGSTGDQKESVTDQYGIEVFSDEFEKNVDGVETQNNEQTQSLNEQIFVVSENSVSSNYVTEQLFGEKREYFYEENIENGNDTHSYSIILIVLICFIIIIVWIANGKKDKNAEHYIKDKYRD